RAAPDDHVVAQPVELIGGDARRHMIGDHVEHLGGQLPGPTHALEIVGAVPDYLARLGQGFAHRVTPWGGKDLPICARDPPRSRPGPCAGSVRTASARPRAA